jgi:transketolase
MTTIAPTTAVNELFSQFMIELGARDRDVYYVVSDGNIAGMQEFEERFPDQFVNVGIAEANGVSMASGLASAGKRVFMWNHVCFLLYRPFDQVRIDVAFSRRKIRLIGSSAGYTRGPDIAQASIEDIGVMRSLPNMTIVCPGDAHEMRRLLPLIDAVDGPVYMRLPRDRALLPLVHTAKTPIELGRAVSVFDGSEAVLISTGHALEEAVDWVRAWRQGGSDVGLLSMHTVKPIDREAVLRLVVAGTPIITIEEHNTIGGLGTAVAEAIAESGRGVPFRRIGIPDRHPYVTGSPAVVKKHLGMPNSNEILEWIRSR